MLVRLSVVATDLAGRRTLRSAPAIALVGDRGSAAPSAAAGFAAAHPEPNDVDGDEVRNEVDNCPTPATGARSTPTGTAPAMPATTTTMATAGRTRRTTAASSPIPTRRRRQRPRYGAACPPVDNDGDGVIKSDDNCDAAANPDQTDLDGDDQGDACDADRDGDRIDDGFDNCPTVYNLEPTDVDGDGFVDDQLDGDGDGIGTACDPDEPAIAGPPPRRASASGARRDRPRLEVGVGRSHRMAAIRDGLVVRLRCSEACAATAELAVGARTRVALASAHPRAGRGLGAAGRCGHHLRLRALRRPRRRALARARRAVRATLTAVAVDAAANRRARSRRSRSVPDGDVAVRTGCSGVTHEGIESREPGADRYWQHGGVAVGWMDRRGRRASWRRSPSVWWRRRWRWERPSGRTSRCRETVRRCRDRSRSRRRRRRTCPRRAENLEVVGHFEVPGVRLGQIADLAVHKGYAYLNSWDDPNCLGGGTYVVDIRNPAAPQLVTFIPAAGPYYHGEGAHVVSVDVPGFKGDILAVNDETYGSNLRWRSDCAPSRQDRRRLRSLRRHDPASPVVLSQGVGDRDPDNDDTHAARVGELLPLRVRVAGRPASVPRGVRQRRARDVDIFDITDPRAPVQVGDHDLDELFPQILDGEQGLGGNVFLHDMVVKHIDGRPMLKATTGMPVTCSST